MSTDITASAESAVDAEARRPRRRLPWSIVLVGVVILGAVAYLIYANTQSNAAYDMTVSQLRQCNACISQVVRVEGTVLKGSIQRNDTMQRLAFVISDGSESLSVVYVGVVPDIFNVGIQVVVEGNYTGQNTAFQAQTLLTKCPSKFTVATPTQ